MKTKRKIQLVECPRDAMQGWKTLIPTRQKTDYLKSLLQVGFHTLDCGSFVSSKAIPQMADTREVLLGLPEIRSETRLLVIVANERGARDACSQAKVNDLGFPFSVSETFQHRNANSGIGEAFERVKSILKICREHGKELVVYLSMAFGNPYGDPYSEQIVYEWAEKLAGLGIRTLSLADTVGLATPEQVYSVSEYVSKLLPECNIGAHLHSGAQNRRAKLEAALEGGCNRFDGALRGIGGCPMANDDLVGNMNTEIIIEWLEEKGLMTGINHPALEESMQLAAEIFM